MKGTVPDLRAKRSEAVESRLSPKKAYLSEVFSSIQGEGTLVGLRQIFIRFSGCSLTCDYCDTKESRAKSPECLILGVDGNTIIQNPVSAKKLTGIVNSFLTTNPDLHHSISLTGGEPLEQVDFLKEWLQEFRNSFSETEKRGRGEGEKKITDSPIPRFTDSYLKIYLETNGLLPAQLSEIIDLVDIIGMDIKLPSVAGVKPFWNLHRDFLKIASRRDVFVKVVVAKRASREELADAADVVASVNHSIPFILQPKTPIDMDTNDLLDVQEIASRKLSHVRVIPQVHKLLNLR